MNTESFVVYIKTEGNYVDVLKDIETIFDTSKYTSDRLIPEGKKRSWLIKDELDARDCCIETKNI